jgi:LmbE family N-acetylglucosaminyl deacetylase
MTKTVLVVAAHPDDEVLGCGGTMARHADEGDRVHVIFVADGVGARQTCQAAEREVRRHAGNDALAILGAVGVHYLDFPDNRLDSLPLLDIVQVLEPLIVAIGPEVIYTHHYGDLNVDHRQVHDAVITACRPMPGSTVREIFTFEVPSSTEWASPDLKPFLPQMRVDVSAQLERKLQALAVYSDEMRPAPHSRSLEHLRAMAIHRGHEAGMAAAEAFMVERLFRS